MSRAFVKESDDGGEVGALPERAVSTHRNLVTATGLEQITAAIRRLEDELTAARAGADPAAVARCQRDLRYWTRRRANAELVPSPRGHDRVRFGSRVRVALRNGTERCFRIVGEDEADPAAGRIAYIAPLARTLIGKGVGDTARWHDGEIEITAISQV